MPAFNPLDRLGVAVLVSQLPYSEGRITLYIAIANLSAGSPMRVEFATSQRFDFGLLDEQGVEYWRWSTGQIFNDALGTIDVQPGKFHLLDLSLDPLPRPGRGSYVTLQGALTSSNLPFKGELRIPFLT